MNKKVNNTGKEIITLKKDLTNLSRKYQNDMTMMDRKLRRLEQSEKATSRKLIRAMSLIKNLESKFNSFIRRR